MKKAILSLFFSISLVMPTMAWQAVFDTDDEYKKEDIKLEGETEDEIEKSLVFPFGAYQTNNNKVCVMSYDFCSNATIHILDACGQTMDCFVSSLSSMQVVSFDINGYPNGTYTLVISTPQGTYLTGVFEVDL